VRRGAAALLAGALLSGCGGPADAPREEAASTAEEPADEEEEVLAQRNQRPVLLFFPGQEGERLVPEERTIFLTGTLSSQVKQAVSELLLGPAAEEGEAEPAFPARTRLLAVFLLADGTAVVDLGNEATGIPHGSAAELAAVYAIVNTVAYNFPGIERVQILVEGQEAATLAGHVDLSRPLAPDLKRIDWGTLGPPRPPAGAAAPWERWTPETPAGERP
jgi:spore germination protein GerM